MLIVGFMYCDVSFSLEEGEARGMVLKIHNLMSFYKQQQQVYIWNLAPLCTQYLLSSILLSITSICFFFFSFSSFLGRAEE